MSLGAMIAIQGCKGRTAVELALLVGTLALFALSLWYVRALDKIH